MSVMKSSGEMDRRMIGPVRGFSRKDSKADEAVTRIVECTSKGLWELPM